MWRDPAPPAGRKGRPALGIPMRCAAVAASAALALSGLAACGDADPDPTDPPTAPATEAPANGDADNGASPTPAESDVELFEFTITGGVADPPLDRVTVEQGTTVRIVVISDEPDELHLHGYDLYADAGPGQEGVLEFVAEQTGLFELETHDTHQVLLQLAVR